MCVSDPGYLGAPSRPGARAADDPLLINPNLVSSGVVRRSIGLPTLRIPQVWVGRVVLKTIAGCREPFDRIGNEFEFAI